SQIVPTVAHALVARSVKRKSGAWGDYQVLVTGPSRTADVEKVLVIPAHGPRKLVVVLCEEPVDLSSLRKPPEANRDAVDR
ncbi:MAG TPA: LUD domain-containing protein, partial [Polyangiaceae bacterium]|nr:LUD domain-containing protein [Polyangiaceae bacterium]